MNFTPKVSRLIQSAREILEEYNPMTLRQVFYQLVARLIIENTVNQYKALSTTLVNARKEGLIPWEWMEDRLRQPREVAMWNSLAEYAQTVERAYRLDVWATQPVQVECWLEKEALSRLFLDAIRPYGVTLNVGRGFDGWDSIHNAAERFGEGDDTIVLYFGDFDPSGEEMVTSMRKRLGELGSQPQIIKCALTMDDIKKYSLPPMPAKPTDSRFKKFVAKNGNVAVELDALPPAVLRQTVINTIESIMDLDALAEVKRQESIDRARIIEKLAA